MHRSLICSGLFGLALATFIGSGAVAETITYKATMNAQSEVPPNESKGAGTAQLTYDTTTKMLTWTVTFSDLSGPATAAHFHGPAEAGKNAGVAVLIGNNPTSPATGMATLTDAQAADLAGGRWYVNVHTAANRGGEIRGQVGK
jgi:CHRD domain